MSNKKSYLTPKNRMLNSTSASSSRKRFGSNPNLSTISSISNTSTRSTMSVNRTLIPSASSQKAEQEFTCDILYNEYLQACLRKKIVERSIKKNTQVLNGQLLYQKDALMNLEAKYHKILADIEDIQKNNRVFEMFNVLEKNVNEVLDTFRKYDTTMTLDRFKAFYEKESKSLLLKDVKPINKQEDLDNLDLNIKNSVELTERLLTIVRENSECHELAELLREHTSLSEKAKKQLELLNQMEDDLTFDTLKSMSDALASK